MKLWGRGGERRVLREKGRKGEEEEAKRREGGR